MNLETKKILVLKTMKELPYIDPFICWKVILTLVKHGLHY